MDEAQKTATSYGIPQPNYSRMIIQERESEVHCKVH